MWKFYCYHDGRPAPKAGAKLTNIWSDWYDAAGDEVQGKHDSTLEHLEQNLTWREPHADNLADGLVEIRIRGQVQWRVLGYYGPGKLEFTVVLICNHKGKTYSPADSLKTAAKRKKDIENGKAKADICERPGKN